MSERRLIAAEFENLDGLDITGEAAPTADDIIAHLSHDDPETNRMAWEVVEALAGKLAGPPRTIEPGWIARPAFRCVSSARLYREDRREHVEGELRSAGCRLVPTEDE